MSITLNPSSSSLMPASNDERGDTWAPEALIIRRYAEQDVNVGCVKRSSTKMICRYPQHNIGPRICTCAKPFQNTPNGYSI